MLKAALLISTSIALLSFPASAAQDKVKIGFISTFSGPQGVLGRELLDGFNLGLKHLGGKLGGAETVIIQGDDQAKPDIGVQLAEKMVERDKVDVITGINFSNVMLAVAKPVLESKTLLLSVNAGPSQLAGKECHPYYFSISYQNDNVAEAMGQFLAAKGVKTVYLMAPNYPSGKDQMNGFKRFYHGQIVGEVYTQFNQPDYAAELAQIRQTKPEAVFYFYPGGMGINFLKQYAQAGLKSEIPLYGPSFSLDQTILPAVGDAALGAFSTSFWSETMDTSLNRKFVADFEATYGRVPSPYAATAYDGALALNSAIKAAGGSKNREAVRKALETVKLDSVRGDIKFNTNHHPIQNYYLYEVVKDPKGRLTNAHRSEVFRQHKDAYFESCKM
ncbi:ABC transporter substrate-binding protein [Paramagnetospirillum caucaseum]|uniref:ABC transporter substrate-binding protein n=1 Tax=Paramagnetospirillum caucaseum TaxID=1244869 RepID=UPI00034915EE|nr:ABC transporter substrate-binding protein [Paramagnetospirillum caucaseum]